MRYQNSELQEKLAADYVMGGMSLLVRKRFETLMRQYPGLQNKVENWQQRLAPLNNGLTEKQPPAKVWRNIKRQTGATHWHDLRFRNIAFAALTAALLCVIIFVNVPKPQSLSLAIKTPANAQWLVTAQRETTKFNIQTINPPQVAPDKTCVLWLSWDGSATQAIAVLPEHIGNRTFQLAQRLAAPIESAHVMVTLENKNQIQNLRGLHPSSDILFSAAWDG